MGRFDALTNKNEEQEKSTIPLVVPSPTPKKPDAQKDLQRNAANQNHEIMNSGIHEDPSLANNSVQKPMKYSTLINPTLVKRIKLHAAECELKDYEVIELALTAYFDKHR